MFETNFEKNVCVVDLILSLEFSRKYRITVIIGEKKRLK
jgi:hypothetical protein